MMRNKLFAIILVFTSVLCFGQKERTEIEDKYKWNLSDIYPSNESWEQAKEEFVAKLDIVKDFKGTVTESSDQLLKVLEYFSGIDKEGRKLFVYASLTSA